MQVDGILHAAAAATTTATDAECRQTGFLLHPQQQKVLSWVIETEPRPSTWAKPSPNATRLEPMWSTLRLATAAFPEGYGKRIVIVSDGNENRESVLDEVRLARSLGITVDTVPITYSHAAEISVTKLIIEPEVRVGQPFDIRVVVESMAQRMQSSCSSSVVHPSRRGRFMGMGRGAVEELPPPSPLGFAFAFVAGEEGLLPIFADIRWTEEWCRPWRSGSY